MSPGAGALLVAAGAVAGVVGTAGGITSLISYPALLAIGLGPLRADVTNIVALVACWPGSALASGPELAGRGRWTWRWGLLAAAGGGGGALLLLSTPAGAFSRIVPFLLCAAAATLLLQPRLSALHPGKARILQPVGVASISLYDGYFGAGAGVMMLALLLVTADRRLPKANALKNMLIGTATAAGALVLAEASRVDWAAAGLVGAGLLAGGAIGPRVARGTPAGLLRTVVALTGIGLAVWLWVSPG